MAAIVAAAIGVLTFGRVGALHGDTFRLMALVGDAYGLLKGSEVWLSGQKVGKVTEIRFLPPAAADTSRRILIEMQVLARYREALHRDAVAQIRAGGGFIGPVVVYLSPGTNRAPTMRDDDTVLARAPVDVESATGQLAAAGREAPLILADVKVLAAQLRTTQGAIGAFMAGPGFGELSKAKIQIVQLSARRRGNGTVGLVIQGGLSRRAGRVMARVDSVRALIASPNAALGRFRRDSSLMTEVADIRNELTLVRAALDEPQGTAGRLLRDSAITNSLADAQREMTLLAADIKKRPLRYISF